MKRYLSPNLKNTMLTRITLITVTALLGCATWLFAQDQQEQGVEPEHYYDMVGVGQVALSPDGEYLVFTRTDIVEEENERHREIWMQHLDNGEPDGEPYRLTDPSVNSTSPRWAPDGKLLSFSSRRDDGEGSVRFLRVDRPGEAFTIEGVTSSPNWSPDGQEIALTRSPEPDERPDAVDRRISPESITNTLDDERFDGYVITHMNYKRDGMEAFRPHYSLGTKSQLFVVGREGGEPEQITDTDFNVRSVEWTPDGERFYFTGNEYEDDEHNDESTTSIYTIRRDGSGFQKLTENPGSQTSPTVSPDGERLVYRDSPERGALTNLMVVDLAADGTFASEPVNITDGWNMGPGGASWTADGDHIRWSTGIRGSSHVFEVPADGSDPVRQVTDGPRRIGSVSFTDDEQLMAYTETDNATPEEVFISGPEGENPIQITSFNEAWTSEIRIERAEDLTWTVEDGTEIHGWVLPPVGYEPGEEYPMILKIHGGPHSAYGETFFQTFHVLSNAGFFVFYPNPRGSSTYGHDYMYATIGEWGFKDEEDFLTGIDAVLEEYPDVDEDRIGVSGGSYGGFMTNWLSARHPERFAAAVTSRSISNWDSFYGVSDAQGLTEHEFFGYPWEERERYRELSPLSYVEGVEDPTLIIHSELDYRTPMPEGEQWYMALKKRDVPVEFVRYPRSHHGLSRTGEPWLLVDRLERISSWFDYWLNEQEGRVVEED